MKYVILMILSFSLPSLAIAESPDNGKVLLEECVLAISLTDKQIKPTPDNVDKFGRGTLCLGFLKGILGNLVGYKPLYILLPGMLLTFILPHKERLKQIGFFLMTVVLPIWLICFVAD